MTERNIQTTFFWHKKVVKINKASYANSAVLRCVDHLQFNQYDATHAEVFDSNSGVLHAVIKRSMKGDLTVLFKREVAEEYGNGK